MYGSSQVKEFKKLGEKYWEKYIESKYSNIQKNIIWNYVSGCITSINDLLRNGLENDPNLQNIKNIMDKSFKYKWNKDLYRVVDWDFMKNMFNITQKNIDKHIGAIIDDPAYMSTTTIFQNPWSDTFFDDELIFHIINNKPINCININKLFDPSDIDCEEQNEIILPRHTKLEIVDFHKVYDDEENHNYYEVYGPNGIYVIDVKIINEHGNIPAILEDLNFEIDNDDNVSLSKNNTFDNVNSNYINSIYSSFIVNKEFDKCIKYYNETNIKYSIQDKDELQNIIKYFDVIHPRRNLNWIDTFKITDMSELFKDMKNFNGDISEWDTSNVENMSSMFEFANSFNQPIGVWNVSKVKNMQHMFANAKKFNQDINKWDTHNVEDMSYMFCLSDFNQYIGDWNVSKVKRMVWMFRFNNFFNMSLKNWDTSNVKDMENMFNDARSFNQDISSWNVDNVINHKYIFGGCPIKEEYRPKFKK